MISPYALLNASRPKSAASVVTPYDLYSAVQNAPEPLSVPAVETAPEQPAPRSPAVPRLQGPRTHYIRDIGMRHSSAAGRTQFSAPPLP